MKYLKKTGWFIVAMLPALLSFLLQIGMGVLVLVVYMVNELSHQQGTLSTDEILNLAANSYVENAMYPIFFYHILGILVFCIWYCLAYGRKKRPTGTEQPTVSKAAIIIWLGLCIQIFTSCALSLIQAIAPSLLKNYIELMEAAGIGETNLITIISVVVLAPIGEELLCRGIIFRLAGKVSSKFWIANIVQAFAFGLIHANLVQGTYAFFMGLALGYIYGKYRRIWLCMLLHASINGSSILLESYFNLYPEKYDIPIMAAHFVVSLLFMFVCFKLLGKRKPVAEED